MIIPVDNYLTQSILYINIRILIYTLIAIITLITVLSIYF